MSKEKFGDFYIDKTVLSVGYFEAGKFVTLAKGRKGDNGEDKFTKLYPSMISEIMISVPIDVNGNIDLLAQKQIAAKYLTVQQCQQEIVEKLNTLIEQKTSI